MPGDYLHGIRVVEVSDGVRPIPVAAASIIGLVGTSPNADPDTFPLDTPVLVVGNQRAKLEKLGSTGTLSPAFDAILAQKGAVVVVVRVAEGETVAETISNFVGSVSAKTGVYALLAAQSELRIKPRLLIAPGYSGAWPDTNLKPPVASALESVARSLRAFAFIDGPNSTNEDVVTMRGHFGTDRTMLIDPWVKVWNPATNAYSDRPPSAYAAGVTNWVDNEFGYHYSPSNRQIIGIEGTSRAIAHSLHEGAVESQYLNSQQITTIVNPMSGGYKLFGNRTTRIDDPLWSFMCVRRVADLIADSIEAGIEWALDKPLTPSWVEDVEASSQAFLDTLKAEGVILGGHVWFERDLNPAQMLQQGKVTFDFDFEPPAPAEKITFRAHRNENYYETLHAQIAATA